MNVNIEQFIRESWRIEGYNDIESKHLEELCRAHADALKVISWSVARVCKLAYLFAGPKGKLRDTAGMDVQVGNHIPIHGGSGVLIATTKLLNWYNGRNESPYELHCMFEKLHPFMDGNGRVGRLLWLWSMRGNAPLGFLHTWYYQSLEHADTSQ